MGFGIRSSLRRWVSRNSRTPWIQSLHRQALELDALVESDSIYGPPLENETPLLERLAPRRFQTALDVGANVGNWTAAASSAWKECRFYSFEPAPETFAQLSAREWPSRVVCEHLALSDSEREETMYFYPSSSELTSSLHVHAHEAQAFQMHMMDGDRYLEQHGIEQVDFLKVDVEGCEYKVLRGFAGAIAAGRVRCIQFEYGAFSLATRFLLQDYYDLLGSRYRIGKLHPEYVDFRDYDWTHERFRFANYLAVTRDEPELVALAKGS